MNVTPLMTASARTHSARLGPAARDRSPVEGPAAAGPMASGDIAADEFRSAMASLAAPVTVVTCYDAAGDPRGLTASAVSSLSLDPPLLLVCLDRKSRTHDVLVAADAFALHLLGPENEALAKRFAGLTEQRFANVSLAAGPTSHRAPQLADCALRLTCARYDVIEGGDHSILVGRVMASDCLGRPAGGLVWHHRGFAHARPAESRA
ncbi:flavin reductase family protein [Streptomyces sp. ID05-18]|uniref:flavin reductase family protein n=1 Tax=Streptomyces sp. ID05-18 TaxID=3028662 RepID=UPI0029B88FCF|nr:flavin reductase family protein [Streptomyces sp. ID05-18]MDX3486247.1 flavin reductase family protein [Streptomyces sp. ID05-18]